MEKRIITISREFGSGGRTIGKLVAEHLGIRCYDAELIQKLAAESGFDESYVRRPESTPPAASSPPPSPTAASVPPTRTCFGSCNTGSSGNWQKKSPASLWDAAPILSCKTAPTA